MVTKKIIPEKLLAYLRHNLSIAELVDWADQTLMQGLHEDDNFHTIRNV